jgi:hypothetical protein
VVMHRCSLKRGRALAMINKNKMQLTQLGGHEKGKETVASPTNPFFPE